MTHWGPHNVRPSRPYKLVLFYFSCCHPTLLVSLYIFIMNVYVRLSQIIKITYLLTYLHWSRWPDRLGKDTVLKQREISWRRCCCCWLQGICLFLCSFCICNVLRRFKTFLFTQAVSVRDQICHQRLWSYDRMALHKLFFGLSIGV